METEKTLTNYYIVENKAFKRVTQNKSHFLRTLFENLLQYGPQKYLRHDYSKTYSKQLKLFSRQ